MAEVKDVEEVKETLLPCTSCGRTFRPEALAKHSKVCEKTLMKKRKTFDSSKQRLQGTELEAYANLSKGKTKESASPKISSPIKTKEKPSDLTKSIQGTRKAVVKSAVASASKPSDHEQCPYCARYFGPKAYSRHVEWCKGQQLKFKHNNINNEARERLQVRTGYRAPLPNKVLTRDKYQPGGTRSREPSVSKGDSTNKPKINEPVNRSHTFSISKNTNNKAQLLERSASNLQNRNNINSPRARKELHFDADSFSSSGCRVTSHVDRSSRMSSRSADKRSIPNKYDPFASAEKQMIELFSTNTQRESSNIIKTEECTQLTSISQRPATSPDTIPIQSATPPTQSPPLISAFAIYSRRTASTENLLFENKENNNIDETVDFVDTSSFLDYDDDNNKQKLNLNNLDSCSVVSIDSVDCNRNPVAEVKFTRSDSDTSCLKHQKVCLPKDVGKCSSAGSASTRSANKYKVNMQQMLYGNISPPPATVHNHKIIDSMVRDINDLNTKTVAVFEECESELLKELEKMLKTSPTSTPSHLTTQPSFPICSSEMIKESVDIKESKEKKFSGNTIDSAYSSLTRVLSEGDTAKVEQARFCHECGTQYPIAMAKFCCNCGMRRIII